MPPGGSIRLLQYPSRGGDPEPRSMATFVENTAMVQISSYRVRSVVVALRLVVAAGRLNVLFKYQSCGIVAHSGHFSPVVVAVKPIILGNEHRFQCGFLLVPIFFTTQLGDLIVCSGYLSFVNFAR